MTTPISRAIFLDIDGVLNDHEETESGYCGIKPACVSELNRILRAASDAHLVISSAWRYLILNGEMTLTGFMWLLLHNGIDCQNRVHGYTRKDVLGCDQGEQERAQQIREYIDAHGIELFVVLDDLDLPIENFIRTNGSVGLTSADAGKAIQILCPSIIGAA